MSIWDGFFKYTKNNLMGNTQAGTWNVLPAVLSTWSNLIQLHNQVSNDTFTLYKQQAHSYIENARKNAELIEKQGAIALRRLDYKAKLERANDVLRVAASNSNIGGTHLDVIVRKEKIRKMDEMALRANYTNQAMMELDNGYRQAAQVYGTVYQNARNVKYGVLNSILKGIEAYTGLTVRDAKVAQSKDLQREYLQTQKNVDAAQDAYYYQGIKPTRVTPILDSIQQEVPDSLRLSGDNTDYSNNLKIINPNIIASDNYEINFKNS